MIAPNERGFDFVILPGRLHSTGAFFCGRKDMGARLVVSKIGEPEEGDRRRIGPSLLVSKTVRKG